MGISLKLAAALLVGTIVLSTALVRGQPIGRQASGKTAWDGAFSAAQAARGRELYAEHCSECHGAVLEGGEHKALNGAQFWIDWQETTVDYLLGRISRNMPYSEDGSLAGTLGLSTYIEIVAHILNTNGFPAGSNELSAASSVGVQITKKGGSTELPGNAFVHIVGCLAKGQGTDWKLTNGSRPVRILDGRPPDERAPLGDSEYTLRFVSTALDRYVGHRMSVSAALVGDGGGDGLNVRRISSVNAACQ
jgi:hypothetical protein